MNDAKPSNTSQSASIKWTTHGGKVEYLNDMDRKVTDDKQPLPKKLIRSIQKKVHKEIQKVLPKDKKIKLQIKK